MIAKSSRQSFMDALRSAARPVSDPAAIPELDDVIGDARIVMLGEATHGTAEFYDWRRVISERLIREHGFDFIAVEGDWPDCQRVHEHVANGEGSPREALAGYRRFPTWMWGNEEVLELVEWLRGYNDALHGRGNSRAMPRKIGFHGLDVYSLYDSMRIVIRYLERVDPQSVSVAREAYDCFERFGEDPERYAYGIRFVPSTCEREVIRALSHMERLESLYSRINPDHTNPGEAYFDAKMNALVTRNAEAYYRTLVGGDAPSWNIRDQHMMETLSLLLEHYGENSRAIVWAHNTHIGDYRATDMKRAGYVNLGGLAREIYGEAAVRLIGFGTHRGTVMAARNWGDPPEIMRIPEALEGSLEDMMHQLVQSQIFLPLRNLPSARRKALAEPVGHRAIGVVYHPPPEHERRGQYVPTKLAERYDGFIFIDQTHAVHALGIPADVSREAETWPSGM
jgi:erythromycin esterase